MNFLLQEPVRSRLIRQAAKGSPCTLQIVNVCNRDWRTTVLAHLQTPKHGSVAGKCSDLSAAFACSACHDAIDGRDQKALDKISMEDREYYKRRAVNRTLHILWQEGILIIKGGGRDKIVEGDYEA